jgi:hypothetical protein
VNTQRVVYVNDAIDFGGDVRAHKKKAHCAASSCLYQLGVGEQDRTLWGKGAEWAQDVSRELETEDGRRILHNIKLLRRRFEPEAVAKEEASRSLRAKGARSIYRARGEDAPYQSPLPL